MSFITNISSTPITGTYNQDGSPSGINEAGTTTSKFSSVTSATTTLVPSSYASGTDSSTSYPFSNSGLPEYEPQVTTGNDTSSNSANSLQPFAQGTVAPQINTSIRNGNWDYYNGWNTDPSSSIASGLLAINVNTDVTEKGANNVGADKSTREQTVAFFQGGGTKSQTLHNGGTVDNCDDCPQTLYDEECLYKVEQTRCTNIETPTDSPSKPDWTRRALFSGKMPSLSNYYGTTDWHEGYFYVNDLFCDTANDISLYSDLFVEGPITETGYEKIGDLVEQIGRDCTFFVNGAEVVYAGTAGTLSDVSNTGYCSGTYNYGSILYETNHLCRNTPEYDLQNVYRWVKTAAGANGGTEGIDFEYIMYGLDFIRYQTGPDGCECLQRYTDGFAGRGEVANAWKAAADAIIARSPECIQIFNQVDLQQCTLAGGGIGGSKMCTAWPTGLVPSGSVINEGTVTGYADPYWSDDECDFIVGVREVEQSGSRNQAECPDDYIATGPTLEMPIKRLVKSHIIGTLWAQGIAVGSPASTGTESFCGETVWMWDGSSWGFSSMSEGCGSTGSPPSHDGGYNGDVATTQCPC